MKTTIEQILDRLDALERATTGVESSTSDFILIKPGPKSGFERIPPKLKKIDMSVCIESGIDCEFGREDKLDSLIIRKLISIDEQGNYITAFDWEYDFCRPRMNHIHASPTGWDKCPLPEGFIITIFKDDGSPMSGRESSDKDNAWTVIRMFEITGIADGYEL